MNDYRMNAQNGSISDREVISRILNGEKEWFELLLRRNNQLLYRVLRGYLKTEHDIEDIMQETYVLAYQKLYQFRGESAFSSWLIRIGINEAMKHFRILKKRMGHFGEAELDEELIIHDKSTPEMDKIKQEDKKNLEKIIDELPSKLRSVFILREVEEMNVNQTAESLGISPENVKTRLHRAKNLLKNKLNESTILDGIYAYGSTHCDKMVAIVMSRINSPELKKEQAGADIDQNRNL